MDLNVLFLFNSLLLGVGLAMDAFSVSLANGLGEPQMKKTKMYGMAGLFGFLQGLMPLIGWVCVHTFIKYFKEFQKFVPWIALFLLLFIGIKMIADGVKEQEEDEIRCTGLWCILMQGIATSIDALSVGFTIAEYNLTMALISTLIIAVVTFIICFAGISIGKKVGTKLSKKAAIFGGAVLIIIGIEIFVTGMF